MQVRSVLQCVAVCCSVLQCVAVSGTQCAAVCCSVLQCVAVLAEGGELKVCINTLSKFEHASINDSISLQNRPKSEEYLLI